MCLALGGAVASIAWKLSEYVDTALVRAVRQSDHARIRSLLDDGARVNRRTSILLAANFTGFTPLMWAAHYRDPEAIRILVNGGADVNLVDPVYRRSALYLVFGGSSEVPAAPCIRELLGAGATASVSKGGAEELLEIAVFSDDAEAVDALLTGMKGEELRFLSGYRALQTAATSGSPEVVEVLLKHGADVHARTSSGLTVIEEARRRETPPQIMSILDRAASH